MEEQNIPLKYVLWDEQEQSEVKLLSKVLVSKGALFIRKLVDSTLIRNVLYEHTSNETDEQQHRNIYVQHWQYAGPYRESILKAAEMFQDSTPSYFEIEIFLIDKEEVRLFTRQQKDPLDISEMLLDHYYSIEGRMYQVEHAIFDHDRHKVLFLLSLADVQ